LSWFSGLEANRLFAQTPFTNEGQVFLIFSNDNSLVEVDINPSNNAIGFTDINIAL